MVYGQVPVPGWYPGHWITHTFSQFFTASQLETLRLTPELQGVDSAHSRIDLISDYCREGNGNGKWCILGRIQMGTYYHSGSSLLAAITLSTLTYLCSSLPERSVWTATVYSFAAYFTTTTLIPHPNIVSLSNIHDLFNVYHCIYTDNALRHMNTG